MEEDLNVSLDEALIRMQEFKKDFYSIDMQMYEAMMKIAHAEGFRLINGNVIKRLAFVERMVEQCRADMNYVINSLEESLGKNDNQAKKKNRIKLVSKNGPTTKKKKNLVVK